MKLLKRIARGGLLWWNALMKDPLKWPSIPAELSWYIRSFRHYQSLCAADHEIAVQDVVLHPVLFQRHTKQMPYDPHYVYQAAWAYRRIADLAPRLHVDVSSNIPFVVSLSATVLVLFLEYHPPRLCLPGLKRVHSDTLHLPFADRSLESLSCLHVIEHIGLGRYGDSLEPQGTRKACSELARCVAPEGSLFISIPIGQRRTEFNAHRVHDPRDIIAYLSDMRLTEFSVVTDAGDLVEYTEPGLYSDSFYACGLYWFSRQ